MSTKIRIAAAMTMTLLAACGGADSESTRCLMGSGSATQVCYAYENLDSALKAQQESQCESAHGTVTGSCPTANVIGCCTTIVAGVVTEECEYSGSAAQFMSTCASSDGTWSTNP